MPASVIAAARDNLSEREKQLAEHLARVDQDLRAPRSKSGGAAAKERMAVAESERSCERARSRCASARQAFAAGSTRSSTISCGRPARRSTRSSKG